MRTDSARLQGSPAALGMTRGDLCRPSLRPKYSAPEKSVHSNVMLSRADGEASQTTKLETLRRLRGSG